MGKKFPDNPHYDMDPEGRQRNFNIEDKPYMCGFLCYRCDKVKVGKYTIHWRTSAGDKELCTSCYSCLCENERISDTLGKPEIKFGDPHEPGDRTPWFSKKALNPANGAAADP